MKWIEEFKKFAIKGNVVDMAVGIVIGASFGTIVKSFVDDILMPPIGLMLGKVDFANLFVVLNPGKSAMPYANLAAAKEAGATTLNIGLFINNIISFIIVALAIFMVVKYINKLKKKDQTQATPDSKVCPYCQSKVDIKASRCAFCTSELK